MVLFDSILHWAIKKRFHEVELFMKYPIETQTDLIKSLISKSSNTEWGRLYNYRSISTIEDFQASVPLSTYEDIAPYIERLLKGEHHLLWPQKINWFAKSSGTTNAKSKFIPVSTDSLNDTHYKSGKDMLSIYVNNYPSNNIFSGKTLSIGGSHQANTLNPKTRLGDVSAVIMQNMPTWAHILRTPSLKTCLLESWEQKLIAMIDETIDENVTSMAGVPTWSLILLQNIIQKSGKSNLLEVWPNLELYAHGAVAFKPYRQIFESLIPSSSMNYMETYSASEGFFGIQDDPYRPDEMLLLLGNGVFYEFIPMEEFSLPDRKAITLDKVECEKNYALVISTNAGLWRYIIGDTVKFTTLYPFRIKITGRTKHFINAFGEELVIENADQAFATACNYTNSLLNNYTGAPYYFSESSNGGHEWLVEFEKQPADLQCFVDMFDQELKRQNSDYEAKRQNDIALRSPIVHVLPKGTFYNWMQSKGKLGGQNKIPRLSNSREYLEEVKSFAGM